MRKILALGLLCSLVAVAGAADPGNQGPNKIPTSSPMNIPDPDRQGGDTIFDATVIPSLPEDGSNWNDTGMTTGYTDDYAPTCYFAGGAPDVVYVYTVEAGVDAITVSLCGSDYDTGLFIYDEALVEIACNDDFCGLQSQLENVPVDVGGVYYIVVDGYSSNFGNYILNVRRAIPCVLECPALGNPEDEPPLQDEYVDHYNGGCNTDQFNPPFQGPILGDHGAGDTEFILCGVSGWYLYQGSNYRDTDWYELQMGPTGMIEVTLDAEQPTYMFELLPQDCPTVGVAQQAIGGACAEGFMTITGYAPGAIVWFWVGPTVFVAPSGADNEYDYIVWFSGLEPGVATESSTWSTIKALY